LVTAALDLYGDPARVVAEAARVLVPGGRWIASSFVAQEPRTSRVPLLSRISGVRKPSVEQLHVWAGAAGLSAFGKRLFRGYVIVWADKS
jgi:hypothetical protein